MDLKTEGRLLTHLYKMFDEDVELTDKSMVTDTCVVMCLEAKSTKARRILKRVQSRENTELPNTTTLDYKNDGLDVLVRINTVYLLWAIKFFEILGEYVDIQAKKDYPINLSNEDFLCIIAPRMIE